MLRPSPPLRAAVTVLTVWCTLTTAGPVRPARAGEMVSKLWRGLSRTSSHQLARAPATAKDGCMERLAGEIDWLEKYIDSYGSIVAKHPDVWGQSRLTRHRVEYEKQLAAELGNFKDLNNGSLRRSDQSFLGMALALQAASRGQSIPGTGTGSPAASAISMISTGTDAVPFTRSAPFAGSGTAPFASFGLADANAINLEPTVQLDHLGNYVKHLQELRRINEGDDNGDSPGYSLNLVRIPVSILPGQYTQRGHGAEITVTADLVLGDDLLPITFRSLVINDLVDTIAPPLTFATNDPATRRAAWQAVNRRALEERTARREEALAVAQAEYAAAEAAANEAQERLAQLEKERDGEQQVIDGASANLTTAAITQLRSLLADDQKKVIETAIRSIASGIGLSATTERPANAEPPATTEPPAITDRDITTAAARLADEIIRPTPTTTQARVTAKTEPLVRAKQAVATENSTLVEEAKTATAKMLGIERQISDVMADDADGRLAEKQKALTDAKALQQSARLTVESLSAALATVRTKLASVSTTVVPASLSRRSRLPIPPSQLADVGGVQQASVLITEIYEALHAHPANRPCIDYNDVRGLLGEELQAAYDLLQQPAVRDVWDTLPAWNLAELVRGRRANELEQRRCEFLTRLGGESGAPADQSPTNPCCNTPRCHALCRSITGVLAWSILVESALLNERLIEDMREAASSQGRITPPGGQWAGPFYGPDPSLPARAAFNDYVRLRWPVRIFALDPVVQEQNIEDMYSKQRELQITMALATAGGRLNSQAASRYARRLETDMATIALNKTAVAFSHGSDTFGWRFYPRFQSPPTRNNIAAFADTLVGSNSQKRDLADRRLEPGIRECTAIIVMPSFVPFINFDVRTNWFSLTNPKATDQSMRQTLQLSRSIKSMQMSAAQCAECAGAYRDGEVARLLRRVEQLDRELPLQSMLTQIPYENTSGGFELFTTGITDLAPELVGWYGAPGIDPDNETTLFLVGKGFSTLDNQVVAGGQFAAVELLSRQVMRVTIPAGAKALRQPSADNCVCPPPPPAPCPPPTAPQALRGPRAPARIARVSAVEPIPAPLVNPLRTTDTGESVLVPLPAQGCPPPAIGFGGAPVEEGLPAPLCADDDLADELNPNCGRDCVDGLFIDVHLATPYGVSGHLLIPVLAPPTAPQPPPVVTAPTPAACTISIDPPVSIDLTTTRTGAGTWRVNEYFDATPDAIRIHVPASFAAPAQAELRWNVRDSSSGPVVATFATPVPHFDSSARSYVLTGGELRNYVGDTSRPATDKTLRGAIKPYLDYVGAQLPANGAQTIDRDLVATAELVSGQQVIPISGSLGITIRQTDQPGDGS